MESSIDARWAISSLKKNEEKKTRPFSFFSRNDLVILLILICSIQLKRKKTNKQKKDDGAASGTLSAQWKGLERRRRRRRRRRQCRCRRLRVHGRVYFQDEHDRVGRRAVGHHQLRSVLQLQFWASK